MKKRILRIIVVAFLVTGIFTGCSSNKSTNTSANQAAKVSNKNVVYFMPGKVEADENVDITSKITAKVAVVSVDVGSVVKKDDPVIKLDSKDLEAQVAQAQAGVNTAKANLAKAQNGTRPEQIAQAQAAFDSAKTNYENTKITYDRNKKLFDSGAISQSGLEQIQSTLAAAEASYKSAQATLDMLNKGETSETIEVYKSQVEQAQAALEFANTQMNNGAIISPIAGVISAKNINAGELATAGVPLFTVVNSNNVIVNAYLPSSLINKVKVGQEVVIKISEIPDKEFNGEISLINSVIDSKSKSILVKVKLKDQDPLLKPGMFAEIGVRE